MSYDIYLVNNDGETIRFAERHHIHGGTYAAGGTHEASLNMTFNYGAIFHDHLGVSICDLDDKSVREVIPLLCDWIARLVRVGGEPSENYWDTNPGNARKALNDLLTLCHMVPLSATVRVDA